MLVAPDVITQYAHEHIPITKRMGIRVLAVDDAQISLLAPYAPNINHRETIFGGSLASLGILTDWALLRAKLQAEAMPHRLVIQSSSTDFIAVATKFRTLGSRGVWDVAPSQGLQPYTPSSPIWLSLYQ